MPAEPFADMQIAPQRWEDLFEAAYRRALSRSVKTTRSPLTTAKRLEVSRVRIAGRYVSERLSRVALSSPRIDEMHPFYRDLLATFVDLDEYKVCLSRIYSVSRIVGRVARECEAGIIKASTPAEAAGYRRMFFGRLRSLLKSLDTCLRKLHEWQVEIAKLPSIDPSIPTVIIAGAPNVGKSSLLRLLSRAKPEVKPYPFTTQTVIVGHMEARQGRVQLIDTPGLLDRPLAERNKIELRAVAAIKNLGGIVIFLFDPTGTCGYPLDYQFRVYREVRDYWGVESILPVSNKVDITDSAQASALIALLGRDARRLFFVSALTGAGVDVLAGYIMERLEGRDSLGDGPWQMYL